MQICAKRENYFEISQLLLVVAIFTNLLRNPRAKPCSSPTTINQAIELIDLCSAGIKYAINKLLDKPDPARTNDVLLAIGHV